VPPVGGTVEPEPPCVAVGLVVSGVELSVHPAASSATAAIAPTIELLRIFMMAPGLIGDSGQPPAWGEVRQEPMVPVSGSFDHGRGRRSR
jgi:hypothetical protein